MTRTADPGTGTARVRLHVTGVVQGVGFRPFVHGLAARLELDGWVGNDASGVVAEVEGAASAVEAFLADVRDRAPALAVVESVETVALPVTGARGFAIVASDAAGGAARTLVSADTATCDACLAELTDPTDRRYGHPFVNCTDCGPRFTIVRDVPYDRSTTTMAGFRMCPACAAEYGDPADRRFHAQPVCCPDCGPTLRLDGDATDPLGRAARRLSGGEILAVKGLGGYHLAVRADDEVAVARLRAAKHREDKPFALMVADLAAVRRLVRCGPAAGALLTSRQRPIVLLPRRTDPDAAPVAPAVAPGNRDLGVMLPATPLHHLLLAAVGVPLVMTSGNVSDEPIAYRDDDAAARLGPLVDGFLTHDRGIHTRVDDSVVRVVRERPVPVRRARGYAPEPVRLGVGARRPVLACGAEQKNTVALLSGRRAFLSAHLGDLENLASSRAFTEAVEHLGRLFDVVPEVVAHDLHPEYLSTKYALDRSDADDLEPVGVQHHHAHVAACLAEHGWGADDPPVLGVAYDGTGYGTDGTIWGGELLLASLRDARRVGHLETVGLPGGAAAVRAPWRMAAAWLGRDGADLAVAARNAVAWDGVVSLARAPMTVATSSAGRLFDAVAALLGVRDTTTYEGQAAVELEQRVDPDETAAYPVSVAAEGVLPVGELVAAVADDVRAGADPGRIAARFHHGLADATVAAAAAAAADHDVGVAALSGGVFVNAVLLERVRAGLEAHGLRVLVHERVPCTDGGISLGQAAVAAARDPVQDSRS